MAETQDTTTTTDDGTVTAGSIQDLLRAAAQQGTADTPAATPAEDTDTDTAAGETPEDEGKGSKSAVLADLAKERDARQDLQKQLDELKTLLAPALGLQPAEAEVAPDVQARIDAAEASAREARTQVAVIRQAPEGTDTAGLLDSNSFVRHMSDVDPDDATAVRRAVKSFLDSNPRFITTPQAPRRGTVRDAGARSEGSVAVSMDDLIRGR